MSTLSTTRYSLPEGTDLLQPTKENPPFGVSLRYDPVYDQIREVRREDDSRLSQGVWITPYKKADWVLVEQLCSEALLTKSKDLQIAGWLTEAWTALDGFEGLARGLNFINALCSAMWDNLYPEITEGDFEFRTHIFEWLNSSIDVLLTSFAVTDSQHYSYTYANWLSASRLDNTAKRSTDPSQLIRKAEGEGELTLSEFNNQFTQTDINFVAERIQGINDSLGALGELKKTVDEKCGDSGPSFAPMEKTLRDIKSLLESQVKLLPERESVEVVEESSVPTLTLPVEGEALAHSPLGLTITRAQAYQELALIADSLEKLEPHSPAPHLLRRIVSWENKNLTEILSTFAETPQDFTVLMRLLGPAGGR